MKPKSPRSLEALVEYQVRKWAVDRERPPEAPKEPERVWPVITVSRAYGSLGAKLAEGVAKRLRFSFWDQELVSSIAEHAGAPAKLFETIDEHRRNAISELIAVFSPKSARASQSRYVTHLLRILHAIGEHGKGVVVGRGAQFVLEPDEALRVRVVMTDAPRIEGLMERQHLSEDEAREKMKRIDEDRRAFIRQTYRRDIDDPTAYDVVINTAKMPPERAVHVVTAAYFARYGLPPK